MKLLHMILVLIFSASAMAGTDNKYELQIPDCLKNKEFHGDGCKVGLFYALRDYEMRYVFARDTPRPVDPKDEVIEFDRYTYLRTAVNNKPVFVTLSKSNNNVIHITSFHPYVWNWKFMEREMKWFEMCSMTDPSIDSKTVAAPVENVKLAPGQEKEYLSKLYCE